jgi:hypothetical protein
VKPKALFGDVKVLKTILTLLSVTEQGGIIDYKLVRGLQAKAEASGTVTSSGKVNSK